MVYPTAPPISVIFWVPHPSVCPHYKHPTVCWSIPLSPLPADQAGADLALPSGAQRKTHSSGSSKPPRAKPTTQTRSAPGRAQPLVWVQQQEADPCQLPPGSPGAPRAGGPAAPPHPHSWATTCSSAQHIHLRGNLSSLELVAEPVGFIPC